MKRKDRLSIWLITMIVTVLVIAGGYFGSILISRLRNPYSVDVLRRVKSGEAVSVAEVTSRLGVATRSDAARWDLMFTDKTAAHVFEMRFLYIKTTPDGQAIIDAKIVDQN